MAPSRCKTRIWNGRVRNQGKATWAYKVRSLFPLLCFNLLTSFYSYDTTATGRSLPLSAPPPLLYRNGHGGPWIFATTLSETTPLSPETRNGEVRISKHKDKPSTFIEHEIGWLFALIRLRTLPRPTHGHYHNSARHAPWGFSECIQVSLCLLALRILCHAATRSILIYLQPHEACLQVLHLRVQLRFLW